MTTSKLYRELVRDFAGFLALAMLAASAGLIVNHVRSKPLPFLYTSKASRLEVAVDDLAGAGQTKVLAMNEPPQTAEPAVSQPSQLITLDEFKKYVKSKEGLVLDARPEIFHRFGHVPGALSLPRDDFESAYANLRPLLEKDKRQPLAVYCSGPDCEDSQMVADALVKLNYTHVLLFKGGWDEWTEANLPQEKAE